MGVFDYQFGQEEQADQMGEHIFIGGVLVKPQPVEETSRWRWWRGGSRFTTAVATGVEVPTRCAHVARRPPKSAAASTVTPTAHFA